MPGQHVADADDAAVGVADQGQSLEGEGRPCTVSEKMHKTPKIARHVAVDECDPDTRVDGKPAVLPGEHVGGGRGVEQASEPEPADHAAADSFGECGQVCGGDWPGRQERRRCVTVCMGSSRQEDAVGYARVEMHVVVERRAKATPSLVRHQ